MKEKEISDAREPTAKMESTGSHTQKCIVLLLNGQEFQCNVEKNANGAQLLRQIRELLDIIEVDYFGLYFEDSARQKYWLEAEKSIKKQLKNSPWKFHLAVKFYPSDPSQLSEDMSRYYMVLQLRDNIVTGSLPCSFVTHALLGSFIVQSELGDYDPASMEGNYVSGFLFAPNQTHSLEKKVIELHKTHKGLTPEEAEIAFLENVKKLPLYGVDQHHVKDSENIDLMLGVSWNGLRVYRDQVQINRFAWPRILKLSYVRRKFHIQIRPVDDQIAESVLGFKLANHKAAKRLWKSCVEHHTFFRLTKPKMSKPKLIRTGSRFRYTGQTQHQTRQTVASSTRKNVPKIQRTNSRKGHTERTVKMSSGDSPSPPELPKKEHAHTTVTTTEVLTVVEEEIVTENIKEPPKVETELVEEVVTTTEETVEIQEKAKEARPKSRSSSSSSSLSSSSDEEMDPVTRHQRKIHKMKRKFLQEPPPGSTESSEWDVRLQSSPAKVEKVPDGQSSKDEVTVVTTVTTEVVEEVVTTKNPEEERKPSSSSSSSEEDEQENEEVAEETIKTAPLPDFVPVVEPESSPELRSSSSSSSSSESEKEETVEAVAEDGQAEEPVQDDSTKPMVVHIEHHVHTTVIQNSYAAAGQYEEEPEKAEEEVEEEEKAVEVEPSARKESTSSSSSESTSSESGAEELKTESVEEPVLNEGEQEEVNENNNNNEDAQQESPEDEVVVMPNVITTVETSLEEEVVVTPIVITTVETKSVRVEDVVIPREDNEVRKVALTADQDNNVTVTETPRSSTSSSSSSSSSDSEPEAPDTGDGPPPVFNGFKKPPIVQTEVAYIEPTEEEKPAVTTQPPVVHTETKTITYESSHHQPDVISATSDVQLLSSQTITAETMSTVTTTQITKTVVGSVSETRVEKSIVITADGDTDIHQAMAEAIKDTQENNPDVNITKVVLHEEKVVENQ